MQTYTDLERLSSEQFKRRTGVSRETFALMRLVAREDFQRHQARGGPRHALAAEDMLLMALTYWREYRTYFHLATEYGISESRCFKIVKQVEKALIADERFHIEGKKGLLAPSQKDGYVVIDVAECPIERPKKKAEKTSRGTTIPAKRIATRSRLSYSSRKTAPSSPSR